LEKVVENAVLGKNCCTGSKGATSYELWLEKPPASDQMILPIERRLLLIGRVPKYSEHLNLDIVIILMCALGNMFLSIEKIMDGARPCHVVSVARKIITVIHNNTHKTAGRTSVIPCEPTFVILLNPDEINLDFEEGIRNVQNDENYIIEPSTIYPAEGQNVLENLPNENLIENEETALEPVIETTPSMTGSVIGIEQIV
jgi:hypothetical protein